MVYLTEQDSLQEDNLQVHQEGTHQVGILQVDSLQPEGTLVVADTLVVAGILVVAGNQRVGILHRVGNVLLLLLQNHGTLSLAHRDSCLYHLPLFFFSLNSTKPNKEFDILHQTRVKDQD